MAAPSTLSLAPLPVLKPAERAFRIEVSRGAAPEEVVLRLTGEAGVGLADQLAGVLLRLSARRPKLVTLDFSELRLIASLSSLTAANYCATFLSALAPSKASLTAA